MLLFYQCSIPRNIKKSFFNLVKSQINTSSSSSAERRTAEQRPPVLSLSPHVLKQVMVGFNRHNYITCYAISHTHYGHDKTLSKYVHRVCNKTVSLCNNNMRPLNSGSSCIIELDVLLNNRRFR